MASVNKVILVGNLGRDPEVRYSAEGSAICNISIATTSQWKDRTSGERREETEWHRVVFYNRLAEIAGEYLRKGRPVYVEGRLRTRKWTGQAGQERFTTERIRHSRLCSAAHSWQLSRCALISARSPAASCMPEPSDVPWNSRAAPIPRWANRFS